MKNNLTIIMCPPLSDYKEAPKDQSHSELFDCPECKEKMWISDKKKGALMFASVLDREILLRCYHCIYKLSEKEPDLFMNFETVEL